MEYKKLYKESNEMAAERFELVTERIEEIAASPEGPKKSQDYFKRTAEFLLLLANIYHKADAAELVAESMTDCERLNQQIYADILPEAYSESYANPDYAVNTLGEECGQILSMLYAHLRKKITEAFRGNLMELTIAMELFVAVYNSF